MSRTLFIAGGVLVGMVGAACGSKLPEPVIRSITPSQIDQGEAPPVRIDTDAVLPFVVDYGAETTTVDRDVRVQIGGLPIANPVFGANGVITGFVPFGLLPAADDVILTLGDGRTATLAGAFTVKPGVFPDSFEIDPIPDQKRGKPFTITVLAIGGAAQTFKGVVAFDVNKGSITPGVSDPFAAGMLHQQVTIDLPATGIVITVRDAAGHTGQSNAFRVGP